MIMQVDKTIYKDYDYVKKLAIINGQIIDYTSEGFTSNSDDTTWIWIIVGIFGVAWVGVLIYYLKKPQSNNDGQIRNESARDLSGEREPHVKELKMK
jgi:hypothetical protein